MPRKDNKPYDIERETPGSVSRPDLLKTSALLGGSMLLPEFALPVMAQDRGWLSEIGSDYIHHLPENQILSACQQCNTNCGMKVKLVNGMVAKIDGNPSSALYVAKIGACCLAAVCLVWCDP